MFSTVLSGYMLATISTTMIVPMPLAITTISSAVRFGGGIGEVYEFC
jgi:hypothetical protein